MVYINFSTKKESTMSERIIFAIGTKIELENSVVGTIVEVSLKDWSEQYRVVWWEGSNRRVEWLEKLELKSVSKTEYTKIGFINV